VLEDMRAKAEAQLDQVRKQENGALHSYELTAQSLQDQAAADTKELGQAKSAKATASETGASVGARGRLRIRAAATRSPTRARSLSATCHTTRRGRGSRTTLRALET